MRIKLALLVAGFASALLVTAPASGVQYGRPDVDNDYPYVGLVVFYDANWNPLWRCSGSLIEPNLFLTAGHCTEDPAEHAAIWFDYDVTAAAHPAYPSPADADATGTPHSHPQWTGRLTLPNTYDVGVVVLDTPVVLPEYGQLAPVGYLDQYETRRGRQDVTLTVVGYGLQSVRPRLSSLRVRMIGSVRLTNLRSALTDGWNLQHTNSPGGGHGAGGTCFGDSGGPVIQNDPELGEIIVAVTSFGLNANCAGTGFAYRVDTTVAQGFIGSF